MAEKHAVKNPRLYRVLHHLNRGGLHRALGVPEGEVIPEAKLKEGLNSSNAHIQRMSALAKTMKGWK